MGSVAPLLAIHTVCRRYHPEAEFLWLGTAFGPEQGVVTKRGIRFRSVPSGKWRRYFSFWNFTDMFKIMWAFCVSFVILSRERPDILISAGGFVSVPVHAAGWLLGIPAWVHQQDVRAGLANKLMANGADIVTVALEESVRLFKHPRVEWIGNPVRDVHSTEETTARIFFNIPAGSRVVLFMGGGTGSARINDLCAQALPHWPRDWQVIHLTGESRTTAESKRAAEIFTNYHAFSFLDEEIKWAFMLSEVVVARAGFSTISELAELHKPSVFIPMRKTHQEENSDFLAAHKAAVVLDEVLTDGAKLAQVVKDLLLHPAMAKTLGDNLHSLLPPAPSEKIMAIINDLAQRTEKER